MHWNCYGNDDIPVNYAQLIHICAHIQVYYLSTYYVHVYYTLCMHTHTHKWSYLNHCPLFGFCFQPIFENRHYYMYVGICFGSTCLHRTVQHALVPVLCFTNILNSSFKKKYKVHASKFRKWVIPIQNM